MDTDIYLAQKIYMDHDCDYDLMNKDNVLEEYKKHNISYDQELKWQEVYKDNLIKNLHVAKSDQKLEYAQKLSVITNKTNDLDCLKALFNATKEMYKANDTNNVIAMCELIPKSISGVLLTSNYIKVREIVTDVMDMLEVLLRKDMIKKPKKEVRTNLDIKGLKGTLK